MDAYYTQKGRSIVEGLGDQGFISGLDPEMQGSFRSSATELHRWSEYTRYSIDANSGSDKGRKRLVWQVSVASLLVAMVRPQIRVTRDNHYTGASGRRTLPLAMVST
jgi:hypothetical protein